MNDRNELLAREYTDGHRHRYLARELGDPRLTFVSPVCELNKPNPEKHLREQVANAYNSGPWCPCCARIVVYVEKGAGS
ncbi:hypothetical protein ABZ215_13415 [Amycolatopsis sp. NPDC006131]|uniref:hypothetical protein n=1 Tax=Amycolatopsis sp. NPDC006131 TaxID=3156731 RepID=UPI0033BDB80D